MISGICGFRSFSSVFAFFSRSSCISRYSSGVSPSSGSEKSFRSFFHDPAALLPLDRPVEEASLSKGKQIPQSCRYTTLLLHAVCRDVLHLLYNRQMPWADPVAPDAPDAFGSRAFCRIGKDSDSVFPAKHLNIPDWFRMRSCRPFLCPLLSSAAMPGLRICSRVHLPAG